MASNKSEQVKDEKPFYLESDWERNNEMLDWCPCCGTTYDQIDWEYQICHVCGHDAERERS